MAAPKKLSGTQRTKAQNPDATTLNIPCLASEKAAWKAKADAKCTAMAAWARDILNKAAKKK